MQFKYYVTDLLQGNVKGTNDDALALELSQSEDFFVVNAETGGWYLIGGDVKDIEEGFLKVSDEEEG